MSLPRRLPVTREGLRVLSRVVAPLAADLTMLGAMLRQYTLPLLLLVLVNLSFSGYQVFSKLAFLEGTNPVVFALLRDGVATALFLPTLYLKERGLAPEEQQLLPRREHLGYFLALGVCLWASSVMSALAIFYLTPVLYALLTPTAPVVTLLLS